MENREKTIKQYTDIDFIRNNWDRENPLKYSSVTIRFLFDKIGYRSPFESNGEYFALYGDWSELFPLFDCIITSDDFDKVEQILNKDISQETKNKIKDLYELFHMY